LRARVGLAPLASLAVACFCRRGVAGGRAIVQTLSGVLHRSGWEPCTSCPFLRWPAHRHAGCASPCQSRLFLKTTMLTLSSTRFAASAADEPAFAEVCVEPALPTATGPSSSTIRRRGRSHIVQLGRSSAEIRAGYIVSAPGKVHLIPHTSTALAAQRKSPYPHRSASDIRANAQSIHAERCRYGTRDLLLFHLRNPAGKAPAHGIDRWSDLLFRLSLL
jgi:hypothetical protein